MLELILLVPGCYAQSACVLQAGSKIFIPQMQGDLDGFIAAEFVKQNIPLTVTQDKDAAKYLMLGLAVEDNPFWSPSLLVLPRTLLALETMKDRVEGNVRLFDIPSNDMAWSGEAGDRHLFFNSLHRSGDRKVAQRIVKHMINGCYFATGTARNPGFGPGSGSQQGKHDRPYDGYPRCSFAPFC